MRRLHDAGHVARILEERRREAGKGVAHAGALGVAAQGDALADGLPQREMAARARPGAPLGPRPAAHDRPAAAFAAVRGRGARSVRASKRSGGSGDAEGDGCVGTTTHAKSERMVKTLAAATARPFLGRVAAAIAWAGVVAGEEVPARVGARRGAHRNEDSAR